MPIVAYLSIPIDTYSFSCICKLKADECGTKPEALVFYSGKRYFYKQENLYF